MCLIPSVGIIGITLLMGQKGGAFGILIFIPTAIFLAVVSAKIFDDTIYPNRLSSLIVLITAVPLEIAIACLIVGDSIWVFFIELCFVEMGGVAGGLALAIIDELIFNRIGVFSEGFMLVLNLIFMVAAITPFLFLGLFLFQYAAHENIIWLILLGCAVVFSFWDYFVLLTDREEDDWVIGRYSPLALFGILQLLRNEKNWQKDHTAGPKTIASNLNATAVILLSLLAYFVSCGGSIAYVSN